MWEESAFLPSEDYKSHTEKKHFGKITVHYGENTRTGKTFFTVTSGAELFDDEEQKSRLETEIVSALGTLMKKYSLLLMKRLPISIEKEQSRTKF